jgi:hypothetical protein
MMTSASADSRKSASERWDLAPLASTYEPSSRDKIPSKMSMPGLVDPSHDTDRELRVEWNRGSEAFWETLRLETSGKAGSEVACCRDQCVLHGTMHRPCICGVVWLPCMRFLTCRGLEKNPRTSA